MIARKQLECKRQWRVLVTGAAGFIGSHLCDRLLADGHEVIGVDDFSTGRSCNLLHLRRRSRFFFIVHDVLQPMRSPAQLDWVLHFASPASPPAYLAEPIRCLRCNADGTFHMLELARQQGAGFLLAGTSEAYGDPLVHPQHEGYWGNVNPVGPRSVYDEGKRYAEALTCAYHRAYGLDTRLVRIFNTYGPRMDPDDGRVISNFICQALRGEALTIYGDGSQTRSFQYVDDLTDAVLRLMRVPYHGPVNLGNPCEFSVRELAERVGELLPEAPAVAYRPLPVDDPRQRRPDISLARRLLGWQPRVDLREGLARSIEYFRAELGTAAPSERQTVQRDGV